VRLGCLLLLMMLVLSDQGILRCQESTDDYRQQERGLFHDIFSFY
jgi:hypothetical protein